MSTFTTRTLVVASIILCAAVTVLWVTNAFVVALDKSQDFEWGPARALLHGSDPYQLYLSCDHCANPPFTTSVAPSYPASSLVLLWPVAMLPWPAAKATWAILNLFFGAGLSLILWRQFDPNNDWRTLAVGSIALFAGTPFLNNLGNGQHAVFTLLWFAAALWAERQGKTAPASLLLAASWFKYSITLPLSLYFVARRQWAILIGAIAVHVVLTAFLAWWTGRSPLDLLLGPLRVAPVGISIGHLDVFGLATRMGLASKLGSWIVAFGLTGAVAGVVLRSEVEEELPLLSVLSLYAYTVVYHLAYDLVILVIPLFYVLSRARSWKRCGPLERLWTVMIAVLLGWTWFADRPVQVMRMEQIPWVMSLYPIYFTASVAWFYATMVIGLALIARGEGTLSLVDRQVGS
jgi:hypothetical protein